MRNSIGIVLVATLALVSVAKVKVVDSATRQPVPPLFRDGPNGRLSDLTRDDETLNYRLPNNTEPISYNVELTTNVHTGDENFTGTVKIELDVLQETRTIVLHARQLKDFVATISGVDDTSVVNEALDISYEDEREFLSLTPNKADVSFLVDNKYILTISYAGELRTDNGGFYLSTYTDEDGNDRNLATTQFESTDARHAFPCYDEPAKRAKFTITINHGASYNAISNMPKDDDLSTSGRTVFKETPSMPTYLVAFIVSDFEWTEGVLNSIPQRVYSRPGTLHQQEFALVSGMLILQRLADYYGVSFSLPQVYQVAVPDFSAGAMENWGLVTYREEYLLYDKDVSTISTQTNIASIIAHEYCHQWFGNLVAIEWWTYLWLKEGFATIFSYQATDAAYPEWDYYQMFQASDFQSALNVDASLSSRPMTYYVQKPSQISSLYDSISYSKGGTVLNMWQQAITDEVFQKGLNNYLTENQFSTGNESLLFSAVQNAAKELNFALPANFSLMMGSWTQQSGYPLLTVERNYNDGSFTVTQKRFFTNESLSEDKLWYVPFNFATQSNPDFRNTTASNYLLKVAEVTLEDAEVSSDDWLILNKQSNTLCRINYDERNWKLIINGLLERPNKIHVRNRAQLMSDAYSFSSSNRLAQSILLELLTYLKNEDQYAPWSTANSIITNFNRYLSGDKDYGNFKLYIQDLVSNIYEKLGVNDMPGEHHLQKYTRSVAINLACLAGIESCLEETNNKLKGHIEEGIAIEPDLKSQTYCNGLRQSSDEVYDYVFNELMESDDQAHRRVLISALGCSQSEEQIKKFVESSIDKSNALRTQERSTLLSSAYSRGETGLLASIEFLDGNWEDYAELNAGFGGGLILDSEIKSMSQYVVNEKQEKALLDLVEKVKDSEHVSSNLETSVNANIESNFEWLNMNRNPLMNWVNDLRKSGSATIQGSLLSLVFSLAVLLLKYC